jgi:hypothetical protein
VIDKCPSLFIDRKSRFQKNGCFCQCPMNTKSPGDKHNTSKRLLGCAFILQTGSTWRSLVPTRGQVTKLVFSEKAGSK